MSGSSADFLCSIMVIPEVLEKKKGCVCFLFSILKPGDDDRIFGCVRD